jgi:hypothetical protein
MRYPRLDPLFLQQYSPEPLWCENMMKNAPPQTFHSAFVPLYQWEELLFIGFTDNSNNLSEDLKKVLPHWKLLKTQAPALEKFWNQHFQKTESPENPSLAENSLPAESPLLPDNLSLDSLNLDNLLPEGLQLSEGFLLSEELQLSELPPQGDSITKQSHNPFEELNSLVLSDESSSFHTNLDKTQIQNSLLPEGLDPDALSHSLPRIEVNSSRSLETPSSKPSPSKVSTPPPPIPISPPPPVTATKTAPPATPVTHSKAEPSILPPVTAAKPTPTPVTPPVTTSAPITTPPTPPPPTQTSSHASYQTMNLPKPYQGQALFVFDSSQQLRLLSSEGGENSSLIVDLSTPSPFRVAYRTRQEFHGKVTPCSTLEKVFGEGIKNPVPSYVTIIPIQQSQTIKGFIVAWSEENIQSIHYLNSLKNCLKEFIL